MILYRYSMASEKAGPARPKLLEFVDLSTNLQDGQQTHILVIDFATAFDKLCNSLLVHKVHQMLWDMWQGQRLDWKLASK